MNSVESLLNAPTQERLELADNLLSLVSKFAVCVYNSMDHPETISVKAAKARYGAGLISEWEKTEGLQKAPSGERGVQWCYNRGVLDALLLRHNIRALLLKSETHHYEY